LRQLRLILGELVDDGLAMVPFASGLVPTKTGLGTNTAAARLISYSRCLAAGILLRRREF
jgi:hypothetical protein